MSTLGVLIVDITRWSEPSGGRLAWIATAADGRPLGTATLRMPEEGRVAEAEIQVHPAERRAGVGSRLLAELIEAGRELGLSALLSDALRADSPGDGFCVARGLRPVLALTYTRLALDGPAPDAPAAPGYRLVHWTGVVPDALAETFARSRRAMDDMPMDDADYVPQSWDVPRLHRIAEAVAGRGEILLTTAAVAGDGEIAGFTEVVVPGDGSGDGLHYGTGVLPADRGRGLARWMKAASIGRVREAFPRLAGLVADTADSNVAMRRINEALGYRPTHRSLLYQADLPD